MRTILRKLNHRINLSHDEYEKLNIYIENLRQNDEHSYKVFYQRYAQILYIDYATHIPRFIYGMDDLLNYLIYHPELLADNGNKISLGMFPEYLQPYINYLLQNTEDYTAFDYFINILRNNSDIRNLELPFPRDNTIVMKFEDSNPYKEKGLKAHFDRLGRYDFISRLQSYRYLSKNKAKQDKIEVLNSDHLGGIFTNKEKSIYYYIFLTEKDRIKADNACKILNISLYGRQL